MFRAMMLTLSLCTLSVLPLHAAARVSLSGIDAQITEINGKIDDLANGAVPTKIDLGGDLADAQTQLTDLTYRVPAGQRFHLREVSCNRGTVTAVLQARQFSLGILSRRFSPRIGSNLRQQIVQTPVAFDAVTLYEITQTVWPRHTFIDAGESIELYLRRELPPFDGIMNNFVCTLSGYMETL